MTDIETHRASRPGYPALVEYEFQIGTERNTGADIAEAVNSQGILLNARSSKSCAARKLARDLVASGAPDGPIKAFRDRRLSYTVRSLHAFARFTVQENPKLHTDRHHEHPFARARSGATGGWSAPGDV